MGIPRYAWEESHELWDFEDFYLWTSCLKARHKILVKSGGMGKMLAARSISEHERFELRRDLVARHIKHILFDPKGQGLDKFGFAHTRLVD